MHSPGFSPSASINQVSYITEMTKEPAPERLSAKASPLVLLAGLLLLAAGITLISLEMKKKAASPAPGEKAQQSLEAPGKSSGKPGKP